MSATKLSENIDDGLLSLAGEQETTLWRVTWNNETSDVFDSREEAEEWSRKFPEIGTGSVQSRTIREMYVATPWTWAG